MRFVAHVEGSWYGPLSEQDVEQLKKGKPPGSTLFWIRRLIPPSMFPEREGWVVLMIEDKRPVDAVGPLGDDSDAQAELRARSHHVLHGSVAPLRPRAQLPGIP
jgi:hypothetical protein